VSRSRSGTARSRGSRIPAGSRSGPEPRAAAAPARLGPPPVVRLRRRSGRAR
jgi:hypothetical protein